MQPEVGGLGCKYCSLFNIPVTRFLKADRFATFNMYDIRAIDGVRATYSTCMSGV